MAERLEIADRAVRKLLRNEEKRMQPVGNRIWRSEEKKDHGDAYGPRPSGVSFLRDIFAPLRSLSQLRRTLKRPIGRLRRPTFMGKHPSGVRALGVEAESSPAASLILGLKAPAEEVLGLRVLLAIIGN